ncbi:hypothetical protein NC651_030963 [Populus alba x Populus x berolinensis]|nr:hypothetical protein NC651_030963 [Populus alba x Populus x berolinensis]
MRGEARRGEAHDFPERRAVRVIKIEKKEEGFASRLALVTSIHVSRHPSKDFMYYACSLQWQSFECQVREEQTVVGGGSKTSKLVNSYVGSSLSKDYPFQLITTFKLDLKLLSLQILDVLEMSFFGWLVHKLTLQFISLLFHYLSSSKSQILPALSTVLHFGHLFKLLDLFQYEYCLLILIRKFDFLDFQCKECTFSCSTTLADITLNCLISPFLNLNRFILPNACDLGSCWVISGIEPNVVVFGFFVILFSLINRNSNT